MAEPKTPQEICSEWKARYETVRTDFSDRDKLFDKLDDSYYGRHWTGELTPLEKDNRVTLHQTQQTVDLAVSLFVSQDMKIAVSTEIENRGSLAQADKVEKFVRGAFYANDHRRGRSVTADFIRDACHYGWGVPRLTFVAGNEMPFTIDAINPKSIYGARGVNGWKWIICASRRARGNIIDEWYSDPEAAEAMQDWAGLDFDEKMLSDTDYMDIWYKEGPEIFNVVIAQGPGKDVLLRSPKPMSQFYVNIPYYPFFAIPTSSPNPHEWGRSLIESQRETEHLLEKSFTHHGAAITKNTAAPIIARTANPDNIHISEALGEVSFLSPDDNESLTYLTWPGSPPDVAFQINYLQQQLQQDGFPLSIYGQGAASSSGYAMQQMSEGGRLRLWPMRVQMQTALTVLCQDLVRMAAKVLPPGQPLPVYGMQEGQPFSVPVTADDLKGFRVHVTLPSKSSQDVMRDAQMATQLGGKLLSIRTAQERYLDVASPEDEEKRMLGEKVMTHPAMLNAAALQGMVYNGVPPEVAQQMLMGQMQQPQGAPPEKPPAIPGTPGALPGRPPLPQELQLPAGAELPPGANVAPVSA